MLAHAAGGRHAFGLRAAGLDVLALGVREARVLARIPVEDVKRHEEEEAEDPGHEERRAPAVVHQDQRDDRHADRGRQLGGRVEDRGRHAPLAGGKPVAGGFGVDRKGRGLGEPEAQARPEEHPERPDGRRQQRENAPAEGRDPPDGLHAVAVEKDADRDLRDGVGPAEGAQQVAEADIIDAELVAQRAAGDGQIDPVEIIDQDSDAQQDRDSPTEVGHTFGGRDDTALQAKPPAGRYPFWLPRPLVRFIGGTREWGDE